MLSSLPLSSLLKSDRISSSVSSRRAEGSARWATPSLASVDFSASPFPSAFALFACSVDDSASFGHPSTVPRRLRPLRLLFGRWCCCRGGFLCGDDTPAFLFDRGGDDAAGGGAAADVDADVADRSTIWQMLRGLTPFLLLSTPEEWPILLCASVGTAAAAAAEDGCATSFFFALEHDCGPNATSTPTASSAIAWGCPPASSDLPFVRPAPSRSPSVGGEDATAATFRSPGAPDPGPDPLSPPPLRDSKKRCFLASWMPSSPSPVSTHCAGVCRSWPSGCPRLRGSVPDDAIMSLMASFVLSGDTWLIVRGSGDEIVASGSLRRRSSSSTPSFCSSLSSPIVSTSSFSTLRRTSVALPSDPSSAFPSLSSDATDSLPLLTPLGLNPASAGSPRG
mmetsp:Transcript_44720/g.136436  ORF Transcript_44720/g.136436 Transcript_44720/m.136436 type:complete len:394 (+) Transcript_44720:1319-2500(+)